MHVSMPAMPVALMGKVSGSCAIGLSQHLLRLVHDVEELRIEMAEQRRRHRPQHAGWTSLGPGPRRSAATDSVDREMT